MNVFNESYMLNRLAKILMQNYFKIETFEPQHKEKDSLFTVTKIITTELQNLSQQRKTENEYTQRGKVVIFAGGLLAFAYQHYLELVDNEQNIDAGVELQIVVALIIKKDFLLNDEEMESVKTTFETWLAHNERGQNE